MTTQYIFFYYRFRKLEESSHMKAALDQHLLDLEARIRTLEWVLYAAFIIPFIILIIPNKVLESKIK